MSNAVELAKKVLDKPTISSPRRVMEELAQAVLSLTERVEELEGAGEEAHASLSDLRRAYAEVQRHYGLKPEQSSLIVAADNARKNWVAALNPPPITTPQEAAGKREE